MQSRNRMMKQNLMINHNHQILSNPLLKNPQNLQRQQKHNQAHKMINRSNQTNKLLSSSKSRVQRKD